MTAVLLIQYLSWLIWSLIFCIVVFKAVRRPRRVTIDVALLFTAPALVIALSLSVTAAFLPRSPWLGPINGTLILLISYLLLRLVDDFTVVPSWLLRGSGILWVMLSLPLFVMPAPLPRWVSLVQVLYFVGLQLYAVFAFSREAHRASGVTMRRMRAIAMGSIFLGLNIGFAGLRLVFPQLPDSVWNILINLCGLASAVCYFIGFATPGVLRRAWQEPELRNFLGRAASLPRLPDTLAIMRELERGAASSLGAAGASIGLWDEETQRLQFYLERGLLEVSPRDNVPVGNAFVRQQALFITKLAFQDSTFEALRQEFQAGAMMVAPITAGEKRLGVLAVYAPRAPIFGDDDLELVRLLADQAAVILESRALIDEAMRVRAREEATRLKDDFLSAAAHDLKTPLTTMIAQAQLLERRAARHPDLPVDLGGIQRLVQEAERLRRLVLELLDTTRAEQGGLSISQEKVDLVALVRESCARQNGERHQCVVEDKGPLVGFYDQVRISQVVDNLIENAIKYSPVGGTVRVSVWREGEQACLAVSDEGIGIPAKDLPHIFERFYRAGNVDDRRFAGMGLGLFICRSIIEQHGGQIWASSKPGQGSTFHVRLPLALTSEGVSEQAG